MKNKETFSWVMNGIGMTLTALQTENVFRIISLILTILATLLSILYTLYNWWKKANKDGKIEPNEVLELKEEIDKERNKIDEKIRRNNQ